MCIADELAIKYVKGNHHDCYWKDCPIDDKYNYQVEDISEIQ